LAGIAVVLCAVLFRVLGGTKASRPWVKWAVMVFLVVLWLPFGQAQIPVVAYVRGISSDLSITLVLLAWVGLLPPVFPVVNALERISVLAAILLAALLLYPMSLGLGDWDPYRLGWGNMWMWGTLLVLVVGCWLSGLRWLPLLVGTAVLCWSAGLMESGNLWDYLLDPWLVLAASVYSVKLVGALLLACFSASRGKPQVSATR
jgi:hypothetical protein